jgi:hypothetical protein
MMFVAGLERELAFNGDDHGARGVSIVGVADMLNQSRASLVV